MSIFCKNDLEAKKKAHARNNEKSKKAVNSEE